MSVHDAAYTPALRIEYGFMRAARSGFLGFQRGRSAIALGSIVRSGESLRSAETTVLDCACASAVRATAKSPTADKKISPDVRRVIRTSKAWGVPNRVGTSDRQYLLQQLNLARPARGCGFLCPSKMTHFGTEGVSKWFPPAKDYSTSALVIFFLCFGGLRRLSGMVRSDGGMPKPSRAKRRASLWIRMRSRFFFVMSGTSKISHHRTQFSETAG